MNLVHQCEYHLSARGTSRMNSDKLDREDPVRQLFHGALKSRDRWDAFDAEVRGRARLNNLLELMRLSYQKVDRVGGYSTDIRRYLETHNGRPERTYREAYDPQFDGNGTQQFNSLWGVSAQIAIREVQSKAALKKLPPR